MVGLALALCRCIPCNPWASYQPVCTQADQEAQEAQPAQRASTEAVISTGHQRSTGKTIVQALYLYNRRVEREQ